MPHQTSRANVLRSRPYVLQILCHILYSLTEKETLEIEFLKQSDQVKGRTQKQIKIIAKTGLESLKV